MPGNVPPVEGERANLLAYLAQHRNGIRLAAFGLTDEQARATPTVREHIDGGTMHPIMAAAENWPESPWMQPWKPTGDQVMP